MMFTLYDIQALLHIIIAIVGYGAIAVYMAPRFSADGQRKWVTIMQGSAIMFFMGCALHHLTMAYHIMSDPQPWMIAWDHIVIELAQAIGAPLFLISTTYIGQIRIDRAIHGTNYITALTSSNRVAVGIVVGLFAGGIIWQGYLLRTDVSPFTYQDGPSFVETPVKIGDPIIITVNRCNNTNHEIHFVSIRVLVNLDNDKRYQLAPGGINMTKPGCESLKVTIDLLPNNIEPGRYVLQSTVQAQGTMRTFYVYQVTTPFEVIDDDK